MSLDQVCWKLFPWGQSWTCPKATHFHMICLYWENMKISSPWYLICSIIYWNSTALVQIMPLQPKWSKIVSIGPKLVHSGGQMFHTGFTYTICLFLKNEKKYSCWKRKKPDIWFVASSAYLYQGCSNYFPGTHFTKAYIRKIPLKNSLLKPQGLEP